jgi:ubiquinone/menaquinone biosynthesis C-methylase UbiE
VNKAAFSGVLAAVMLAPAVWGQGGPSDAEREKRRYWFEPQEVTVPDFPAEGYILDIGGGGEGIIGLLKPKQAIAIDLIKRELEEAPAGPLKILMDARDLKFLDGTFSTATSFFTLMFVKGADHPQVFKEVYRVLVDGGRFLVWDIAVPERIDPAKDLAVFRLRVRLPAREVNTGYGMFWPEKAQDIPYYRALAERTGFRVARQERSGRTFFLELRK